jgi:hypothetical protein
MNTVKNAATNIKESFKDTMNDMHQYSEEKWILIFLGTINNIKKDENKWINSGERLNGIWIRNTRT